MKSVRIRSYSGPYFPAFGLLSLHIQFKCRTIRTRITPNTDIFHTLFGNYESLFFKKVQRITLSCGRNHRTLAGRNHRTLAGRNHRTLAGRCFSVINSLSSSKNSYYFLTKNNGNIKVETKKTPTMQSLT